MSAIIFSIPGPPQGKARPKVMRLKNGFSHTYTPDKTVAYEELVRCRYQAAAQGFHFQDGAQVELQIIARYTIPKSTSKKKRVAMLAGQILPTKKPDCDNVVKIICDALNGFAYKDDQQIVKAFIVKKYAAVPQVDVRLSEVTSP